MTKDELTAKYTSIHDENVNSIYPEKYFKAHVAAKVMLCLLCAKPVVALYRYVKLYTWTHANEPDEYSGFKLQYVTEYYNDLKENLQDV